ncbi:hypothetical protein [Sporosarcina sp. YIM B06819]|uniref:hypothetical protein n=1 Tax=Sporosarcina sp. YIM B06819 TaxID=3081769 RepID=UPI00298D282A|nr:hypothetical protein [Sporosarcina sp. YIM B06819]
MTDTKANERTIEVPRISIKWIYVGPLSGKGGDIRSHSINEETVKEEMMERGKLGQFNIRRSEISSLPSSEKRRNEIEEIRKSNPLLGREMSEELQEDIKKEAIEFVEVMFQRFTSESFYVILESGGSVDDLYEDAKKKLS